MSTTLVSRGRRPLWFGQILPWSPTERGFRTHYCGQEHEIIKVSSRWARELGNGHHAGWHFAIHPEAHDLDPRERHLFGPDLGGRREHAQLMAEAWILAGESILKGGDGAPSLDVALGGDGAGFSARSGRTLLAWPMPTEALLEIRTDGGVFSKPRSGDLMGTVSVAFFTDDPDGVAAGDTPVVLTWTSAMDDGTVLDTYPTWHEACRAIGATT